MLWFSDNVIEYSEDYTRCIEASGSKTCDEIISEKKNASEKDPKCSCDVLINIKEDMEGDVFIYYGLGNFYQNHRRYVKSRDDQQLLGDVKKEPSSECAPFHVDEKGTPYVPCGAIANSLFSGKYVSSWLH